MQPTLFSRRVTHPSLPISCAQQSHLKITLTLPKRRSTTYFSQHYLVERSPSLVFCVSLFLWQPLKEGKAYPTYGLNLHSRSTAVCWFYVNNSTARRFYYHTEHVHGGRREFQGGVKRPYQASKTASVKSRIESIDSTLPSDLLRSVNQSRDKGAQCLLSIKA